MWILLAFSSAFFNGCYDISKKMAVNNNAVLQVLFFSSLCAILILSPIAFLSYFHPNSVQNGIFYIPTLTLNTHLYIFIRATIIVSAWLVGYSALKHLPITISGPINATRPVMTLVLALFIFNEKLNIYQWIGVFITIISLFLLSSSSKKEGVQFSNNKWIYFAFLGALIGSSSELYEKFLMSHLSVFSVQFWTSVYECAIIGIILLCEFSMPKFKKRDGFRFRWSIFFIALFLMLGDFTYLYALTDPDSMISIVSLIKRSSVMISFAGGVIFFKEKNLTAKIIDLFLIIIGMFFLYMGTTY